MTTTIDGAEPTRHPDVSEIADLTEDLLPEGRAAEVRDHLEACDACAGTHASLAEIRTLLGDLGELPAPQPMPTEVAARIDAVLASETLEQHTEADPWLSTSTDVSRETSVPEVASAEHSPAAVARPDGYPRAATGPGREPRRRRRRAVIGAALTAAAIGLGTFMLQSADEQNGGTASDRSDKDEIGNFSGDPVPNRVSTLLDHPVTEKSMSTKRAPDSPLEAPVVSLPACVARSIPGSERALAADEGKYQETPAYLVVLPHPTDGARVSVFVVATSCEGAEPPAKGDVLLSTSYPLN